ncbi:MAG: hypothetical protein WCG47_19420 [Dermatophilaceae bacterium]
MAYNETATKSTSVSGRWRFLTITGSNVPPVPGDLDGDLTGCVGQPRLGPGVVANVPTLAVGRWMVLVVAPVLAHLVLERTPAPAR